ncbi:hypothetical protein GCM10027360_92510 [Amycolatopsis echigonensis]
MVAECGLSEAQVVGHAVGERDGLLGDQADAAAQVEHVKFGDGDAVEQDLAAVGVVQPVEQAQQGGFAGSAVKEGREAWRGDHCC